MNAKIVHAPWTSRGERDKYDTIVDAVFSLYVSGNRHHVCGRYCGADIANKCAYAARTKEKQCWRYMQIGDLHIHGYCGAGEHIGYSAHITNVRSSNDKSVIANCAKIFNTKALTIEDGGMNMLNDMPNLEKIYLERDSAENPVSSYLQNNTTVTDLHIGTGCVDIAKLVDGLENNDIRRLSFGNIGTDMSGLEAYISSHRLDYLRVSGFSVNVLPTLHEKGIDVTELKLDIIGDYFAEIFMKSDKVYINKITVDKLHVGIFICWDSFSNLTSLVISDLVCALSPLANWLKYNTRLTTLHIRMHDIFSVSNWLDNFTHNVTLTSLQLPGNLCGETSLENVMRHNTTLTYMDLGTAWLSAQAFEKCIMATHINSRITCLLSSNLPWYSLVSRICEFTNIEIAGYPSVIPEQRNLRLNRECKLVKLCSDKLFCAQ